MRALAKFNYQPGEHEAEKASNVYLMSLVIIMVGLPLPIINLIATLFFYLGNRNGGHFVRWHCTQALLSQASLFLINSVGFWWTISILFGSEAISNLYLSYMIAMLVVNLIEFIATIYTSIKIRKGIHVEWMFYGQLTTIICKK